MATQERLKELFKYDATGRLVRIKAVRGCRVGDIAGTAHNKGYQSVMVDGKRYLLHRLIWMIHHGDCPKFLDHKDRNKSNNCIENLRPASSSQNNVNRAKRKNTSSNKIGVSWHSAKNKWRAALTYKGNHIHLGYFPTQKSAHDAYRMKALELYGEFLA